MYNFQLGVLYVQFKYQSSGLTTAQEVEVVEAGALACLTLFLALALAVHLFYQVSESSITTDLLDNRCYSIADDENN